MKKFYDVWSFLFYRQFFASQVKPQEIFYRSIYISAFRSIYMRDIQRIFGKYPTIFVL